MQQKGNNVDHAGPVATPVTVPAPLVLPVDLSAVEQQKRNNAGQAGAAATPVSLAARLALSAVTQEQKSNNTDQSATLAALVAVNLPVEWPVDPDSDWRGGQDGAQTPVEDPNEIAQAAGAGGAPQVNTPQAPGLGAGGPQNTAFMLRMQVAADGDAGKNAGSPGQKQAGDADAQDGPPLPQSTGPAQSVVSAFESRPQVEFSAEVKQAAAPPQSAELRALRTDEPAHAPKPLNSILLQVNQSADEKVVVRLVQQPGELRLAVHTNDSTLASGLQEGLPDLVGKLQGSGFRADTWHPFQSSVAANAAPESQNASNHSSQGDAQSHPGGSQQDGSQQQKNKPNRPRWAEEMEFSLTSKDQAPGESYGFRS